MSFPCHIVRQLILSLVLKKKGNHTAICRNVELRSPYRITIGSNSVINKRVLLDGRGGELIIGNNVDIAQEVYIWTEQHDYDSPNYSNKGGNIVIDDYVWIASRATILPNVHIGRGGCYSYRSCSNKRCTTVSYCWRGTREDNKISAGLYGI